MNTTSSNYQPTPLIEKFLQQVNRITAKLGLEVPQIVQIGKLRTLPEGSFGKEWANFCDSHQLKPFTKGSRRQQLHDGIHVLTGYNSDPLGEAKVQAFLLGTKLNPINLILGLGLLRIASKTNSLSYLNQHLWQAYQKGRTAKIDPDTWQPEQMWELPIEEVQTRFGL